MTNKKNKYPEHWHQETKSFYDQCATVFEEGDALRIVLQRTAEHLNHVITAQNSLQDDDFSKKNHALDAMKGSWSAFISGCKLMGVENTDSKLRVGRPPMFVEEEDNPFIRKKS